MGETQSVIDTANLGAAFTAASKGPCRLHPGAWFVRFVTDIANAAPSGLTPSHPSTATGTHKFTEGDLSTCSLAIAFDRMIEAFSAELLFAIRVGTPEPVWAQWMGGGEVDDGMRDK